MSCRFAIVGSGMIAQLHAEAVAGVPGARLVAVQGRNPGAVADLAGRYAADAVSTVDELVARDDVDAVLIATPSGAHREPALAALRAGKAVLCEKPLEVTVERTADMIAEARRQGVRLAGFFPLRCGSGAQAIRTALDQGRFGRLTLVRARVRWWRSPEYYASSAWRGTWDLDGGGALMNQGIHAVDLLQWFGGRPVSVSAFADTLAHPGLPVEDTLAAAIQFENGALGTLEASTACQPGLAVSLEVSGDRGTAVLVNDRIDFWQFREPCPGDDLIREGIGSGQVGGGAADPKAITSEGHRRQIAEFCKALRGEEADVIDGTEAAAAVSVITACYRAARSGQRESVHYLG